MKNRIIFTATAENDLRSVAFYIAEQTSSKAAAADFVRKLKEKCGRLEDFPEMGALPRDRVLTSLGFRFLVCGDYLLFYTHDSVKCEVYVSAVIHSKQDYMRVMRKYIM